MKRQKFPYVLNFAILFEIIHFWRSQSRSNHDKIDLAYHIKELNELFDFKSIMTYEYNVSKGMMQIDKSISIALTQRIFYDANW